MKKALPVLLTLASTGFAAQKVNCAPTPPATCYPAECNCYYCLGPVKYQGNTPVRPFTCNGDFAVTVAGFYWNAHQDGMEYAIDDAVSVPDPDNGSEVQRIHNLVDAKYETPQFKWDFGFKVGLGYNTTCDGWDLGATWTWYRAKASSHIEAEPCDNHTLIAIWSAFNGRAGVNNFACDAETNWKARFNLVDLFVGREYWTSKYLSMRPYVGLRIAYIKQDYLITYKGGSWTESPGDLPSLIGEVDLDNDFHGVGVRCGFDFNWNLDCGWSIYHNLAASIVYGRFDINHEETAKEAQTPFTNFHLLETNDHFRASRPMLDLELGVQWQGLFSDCQYKLTGRLAWEHHLFFHQNQMWRVNRFGDTFDLPLPNDTGENVFFQRRGTLDTQGWTLTIQFEF